MKDEKIAKRGEGAEMGREGHGVVRIDQDLRRDDAVAAEARVHGGNEEAANEDGVDAAGGGRVHVAGEVTVQGMQGQWGNGQPEDKRGGDSGGPGRAEGREGTSGAGYQGGPQQEDLRQREPRGDSRDGAGAAGQQSGVCGGTSTREGVTAAILMAAAQEKMHVEMFEVGGRGQDRDAVAEAQQWAVASGGRLDY